MNDDANWLVILADKVRDLVQQFGVEPFQAELLEWKAVYDAHEMAVTTYDREKQEYFKRAWKEPRLRDSSAGPPEEGYVWASGSFDTEEDHILAAAWVPERLGDDARPEDPDLPLPLPDRLLNLHEEYVVLSAIHDRYSPGEKISPWPDDWTETRTEEEYQIRRPEMKCAMLYWLLCRSVPELRDVDRPRLESALKRATAAATIADAIDAEADLLLDIDDSPPDELLAELSRQQRKLITHLWNHQTSTLTELHDNVWAPNVVENATVQRAVERLHDRLLEFGHTAITVENSGEYVVLKRPDK